MKTHCDNVISIEPGLSDSILNSLRDQICLIDLKGIISFVNKEWIRIAEINDWSLSSCGIGVNYLQQSKSEPIVFEGLKAILSGEEDHFNFEYPCHFQSERKWFLMQATPLLTSGKIEGAVIRHVDITKQKLLELKLKKYAEKDSLTSLFNRRYFEEQLTREVSHALQKGIYLSLLYIDADNFKTINDVYGHPTGDKVLKELANQILCVIRSTDTAARIGGDEFAILLPDTDKNELEIIANRLINYIRHLNLHAHNQAIDITISIGGRSFKDDISLSSMMEWVDKALYSAKDKGKNQVVII